jgi:predicted deacylase
VPRKGEFVAGNSLTVGNCIAAPGTIAYGTFEGVPLPTGGFDELPVVIVSGKRDGPTLWLTANIHGDEVAGIPVLHRLLLDDLSARLRGTLVVMPSLNLAGLRTRKRHPYYDDRDPNRTFPGRRRNDDPSREPTVFERLTARLFDAMKGSADYYIDLHCASILSIPFSIRDRVLYKQESDRPAAEALSKKLDEMVTAFGFGAVAEYSAPQYVAKELHRSTTGSALQELSVPAFTVELGGHTIASEPNVAAAVIGLRNVMRWASMLDGPSETMPVLPMPPDGRVRRRDDGPYPSHAGILDYKAAPGDHILAGGVVAEIRDLWGRPVGDGVVRAAADSWIIGLEDGILAYPGAAIAHIGLVDDGPLVEAWPP